MQISPEKIKYFRQENGWSQDVLAKASGLSLRTIQRAEKEGNASAESQLAIAGALNKPLQDLALVSSQIEANWKWRNIMQSVLGIISVLGAIIMLVILGGDIGMFTDCYSIIYILLFMYAATGIAYGGHGIMKSVLGFKYLFTNEISSSDATLFLSTIIKQQIYFVYGGAFIGIIIGYIAILSHYNELIANESLYAAYAVCLLVLLYAAIIAEGILRPLSAKLNRHQISTISTPTQ